MFRYSLKTNPVIDDYNSKRCSSSSQREKTRNLFLVLTHSECVRFISVNPKGLKIYRTQCQFNVAINSEAQPLTNCTQHRNTEQNSCVLLNYSPIYNNNCSVCFFLVLNRGNDWKRGIFWCLERRRKEGYFVRIAGGAHNQSSSVCNFIAIPILLRSTMTMRKSKMAVNELLFDV